MKNKDNFKPDFYLMFLDITKIFDYKELQLEANYKYPVVDFDKDGTPLITNQYNELITLFPEELQYTILIENDELDYDIAKELESGYGKLIENTIKGKEGVKMLGDGDTIHWITKKEANEGVKMAEQLLINRKNLKESLIDRYLEKGEFEEIEKLLKNNLF